MQDGLTGISNRRHFDQALEDEIKSANATKAPLSLILIDIDHFKLFNDCYGHQKGDDCLIKVAKTISKQCKNTEDMSARYGGEEFVILLPKTDEKNAFSVAERARKAIEDLCIEHKDSSTSKCISISLGIGTMNPDENMDSKSLIERADSALYKAKEIGRNQTVMASDL